MMDNLQSNLCKWKEKLAEDAVANQQKASSITAPVQEAVEKDVEDSNDSSRSSNSSSDSKTDTSHLVASTAVPQAVFGRRHSLPLNVPSMLPRTVIRRESLSKDGQCPIVLETIQMEGMCLSSLSQVDSTKDSCEAGSTLTPVITKIEEGTQLLPKRQVSSEPSKATKRRLSLPPLLSQHQRYKQPHVFKLHPLPATPSLEDLRVPGQEEVEESEEDKKKLLPSCCDSSTQSSSQADDSDPVSTVFPARDSHSTAQYTERLQINSESCQTIDNTAKSMVDNSLKPIFADNSQDLFTTSTGVSKQFSNVTHIPPVVHPPPTVSPALHGSLFSESQKPCLEPAVHHSTKASHIGKSLRFARRASLDSNTCTNINLNENINLQRVRNNNAYECISNLKNSNTNMNNINRSNANLKRVCLLNDKENRAPCKARLSLLAKTRQWRSLNQDDECACDTVRNSQFAAKLLSQQVRTTFFITPMVI